MHQQDKPAAQAAHQNHAQNKELESQQSQTTAFQIKHQNQCGSGILADPHSTAQIYSQQVNLMKKLQSYETRFLEMKLKMQELESNRKIVSDSQI